jgi:hypothetical protein
MNPEYLHKLFSESDYGDTLRQNIRFGDFKPDYVSNHLWESILGDDVNNLRHMPNTLEIARKFMAYHDVGNTALFETVAITHDWGEAVVGDVALPDKDLAGVDDKEVEAYKKIAWELWGEGLEEVPDVVWGEHELSEPFNAIEYIGYCQTGLRAGKMACLLANGILKLEMPRKRSDGLVGGLLALNKLVEVKNYPKLAKHSEKYPYIHKVFV